MKFKRLISPRRRRKVPAQFSWVDHRLVRDRHIDRCTPEALALYLFLVTVADADGLSYYSDPKVAQRLSMDPAGLAAARRVLLATELIAYERPLYQVLSLEPEIVLPARPATPRLSSPSPASPEGARSIGDILDGLQGGPR